MQLERRADAAPTLAALAAGTLAHTSGRFTSSAASFVTASSLPPTKKKQPGTPPIFSSMRYAKSSAPSMGSPAADTGSPRSPAAATTWS